MHKVHFFSVSHLLQELADEFKLMGNLKAQGPNLVRLDVLLLQDIVDGLHGLLSVRLLELVELRVGDFGLDVRLEVLMVIPI